MLCNDGIGNHHRALASRPGERTGREYPNLSDWTQNSVAIPGSGEFLSFADRERASVYLWRVDDEPSITTPIAAGQSAADGFGDHSGLIVTATPEDGISRTAGCGMSPRMHRSVTRRTPCRGSPTPSCGGGVRRPERAREHRDGTRVCRGPHDSVPPTTSCTPGARAAGVRRRGARVIPIDPETGESRRRGDPLPRRGSPEQLASISELVAPKAVAVTWFDPVDSRRHHRRSSTSAPARRPPAACWRRSRWRHPTATSSAPAARVARSTFDSRPASRCRSPASRRSSCRCPATVARC